MRIYVYAILAIGWFAWSLPFLLARRNAEPAKEVDRRARWGIALVAISYAILWQGRFWERSFSGWRVAAGAFFLTLAALLSWTSTRALGRQWRLDAGLSSDHELVMTGPYRIIRHPIYTSMLCVLLGTGFMISSWPLFVTALAVFIVGTEIRVRIEDKLLASRFGDRFLAYQRSVGAYIPFVKA
jgi:protein-S-isoprenylcysteine O-methyltransferase Ste14